MTLPENGRHEESQDASLDTNPFRYSDEYFDKETGTIYLRARYYGPTTGRFLTEDTHWNTNNMIYGNDSGDNHMPNIAAIIQSSNLHVYCMNNPLRWIDPSVKVVTDWDRATLPKKQIDKLESLTASWSSGTKEKQNQWRAEAEAIRAMWRNEYEYTDSSGITRSTETHNEIKFRNSDTQLGTGTLFIQAGYSLNNQAEVVLATYRSRAYSISGGIGIKYNTDTQSFTTDGSSIYYTVTYSITTPAKVPIAGVEYEYESGGGKLTGAFHNLK